MLAQDFESGLAMIEMKFLPFLLFVAVLACLAQRAFVFVLLGMTAIAGLDHLPIFFARGMAFPAKNFFG
jgi:hypothetical protein